MVNNAQAKYSKNPAPKVCTVPLPVFYPYDTENIPSIHKELSEPLPVYYLTKEGEIIDYRSLNLSPGPKAVDVVHPILSPTTSLRHPSDYSSNEPISVFNKKSLPTHYPIRNATHPISNSSVLKTPIVFSHTITNKPFEIHSIPSSPKGKHIPCSFSPSTPSSSSSFSSSSSLVRSHHVIPPPLGRHMAPMSSLDPTPKKLELLRSPLSFSSPQFRFGPESCYIKQFSFFKKRRDIMSTHSIHSKIPFIIKKSNSNFSYKRIHKICKDQIAVPYIHSPCLTSLKSSSPLCLPDECLSSLVSEHLETLQTVPLSSQSSLSVPIKLNAEVIQCPEFQTVDNNIQQIDIGSTLNSDITLCPSDRLHSNYDNYSYPTDKSILNPVSNSQTMNNTNMTHICNPSLNTENLLKMNRHSWPIEQDQQDQTHDRVNLMNFPNDLSTSYMCSNPTLNELNQTKTRVFSNTAVNLHSPRPLYFEPKRFGLLYDTTTFQTTISAILKTFPIYTELSNPLICEENNLSCSYLLEKVVNWGAHGVVFRAQIVFRHVLQHVSSITTSMNPGLLNNDSHYISTSQHSYSPVVHQQETQTLFNINDQTTTEHTFLTQIPTSSLRLTLQDRTEYCHDKIRYQGSVSPRQLNTSRLQPTIISHHKTYSRTPRQHDSKTSRMTQDYIQHKQPGTSLDVSCMTHRSNKQYDDFFKQQPSLTFRDSTTQLIQATNQQRMTKKNERLLTNLPVAVKIVYIDQSNRWSPYEKDELDRVSLEASLLSQLDHECIPQLWESFSISPSFCVIVQEYLVGSVRRLYQELGPLPEWMICFILQDIVSALHYLHFELSETLGFICLHRDIKAANILISSNAKAKLVDFGVSNVIPIGGVSRTFVGTPKWMSPEVANLGEEGVGTASDIWSLGITIIEMATGHLPESIQNKTHEDVLQLIGFDHLYEPRLNDGTYPMRCGFIYKTDQSSSDSNELYDPTSLPQPPMDLKQTSESLDSSLPPSVNVPIEAEYRQLQRHGVEWIPPYHTNSQRQLVDIQKKNDEHIEKQSFIQQKRVLVGNKTHHSPTRHSQYIHLTFSKELKDFVSLCIQRDPNKRANAKELLDHPFLTNMKKRPVSYRDLFIQLHKFASQRKFVTLYPKRFDKESISSFHLKDLSPSSVIEDSVNIHEQDLSCSTHIGSTSSLMNDKNHIPLITSPLFRQLSRLFRIHHTTEKEKEKEKEEEINPESLLESTSSCVEIENDRTQNQLLPTTSYHDVSSSSSSSSVCHHSNKWMFLNKESYHVTLHDPIDQCIKTDVQQGVLPKTNRLSLSSSSTVQSRLPFPLHDPSVVSQSHSSIVDMTQQRTMLMNEQPFYVTSSHNKKKSHSDIYYCQDNQFYELQDPRLLVTENQDVLTHEQYHNTNSISHHDYYPMTPPTIGSPLTPQFSSYPQVIIATPRLSSNDHLKQQYPLTAYSLEVKSPTRHHDVIITEPIPERLQQHSLDTEQRQHALSSCSVSPYIHNTINHELNINVHPSVSSTPPINLHQTGSDDTHQSSSNPWGHLESRVMVENQHICETTPQTNTTLSYHTKMS